MKKIIVVVGPTAVGKTKFAIDLAQKLNTEIISADSRQIFKEMKIGTASPTEKELSMVKHHFIASHSIFDYYNASMYEFETIPLIDEILTKNEYVVVVGGSGLYIDAILYGIDDLPTVDEQVRSEIQQKYEKEGIESLRFMLKNIDPETYKKIDLRNYKRIQKALEISIQTGKPYSTFLTGTKKVRNFEPIIVFLNRNRNELHQRINLRVDQMIEQGLENEAQELLENRNLVPLKTVGYREMFEYFDKKIDLDRAIELIKRNTRRYARRQITWFKRYENANILDITNGYNIDEFVEQIL